MLYRVCCCWLLLNLWPLLVGVSLFTCTCSVYLAGVFVCFCSLLSCLTIITYCHVGGQPDELSAFLAARCRVCLPSSLYCILFTARWQINEVYDRSINWLIDWLIDRLIDWWIDDWLMIDCSWLNVWFCLDVNSADQVYTAGVSREREPKLTPEHCQRDPEESGFWRCLATDSCLPRRHLYQPIVPNQLQAWCVKFIGSVI